MLFTVLLSSAAGGIAHAAPLAGSGEGHEEPDAFLHIEPPAAHPLVGERLSFHGRWFGVPVGSAWIEVKEQLMVDGRTAYHLEAQGFSNELLSTFYPIQDIVRSHLDGHTFLPLQFEKDQREGRYRAHEVVTFDHTRRLAVYRSLLNQSVKEIPLPEEFQDLISALYWFRSQPLVPGQPLAVNLYTDEKVYRTVIDVSEPQPLELLKRGTFACVRVEPKASFQGLLVTRGRLWAYVTIDAHRLPLLVQATTPWGPMSMVIDEASIPPTVRRR